MWITSSLKENITHARTHTHAHTHTNAHTFAYEFTHAHTHTHAHLHTAYTNTHLHTHSLSLSLSCTRTRSRVHTHTRACAHTHNIHLQTTRTLSTYHTQKCTRMGNLFKFWICYMHIYYTRIRMSKLLKSTWLPTLWPSPPAIRLNDKCTTHTCTHSHGQLLEVHLATDYIDHHLLYPYCTHV